MSGFLIDTNCISELIRPQPDRRVMEWMDATNEALLYLSVLTLGEIRKGLAALPQGTRRTKLETWLEIDLKTRFHGRILLVDAAVADRFETKRKGKSLPVIDGLLASTALHHNLTVVSRNVSDFANARVAVLNPWEG